MRHIKLFESFIFEKELDKNPWWKKYTKYELSAYPVNIPEEDVTIDLSGDIDTHPVMTWNSPTTGKKVYSYTKVRMDAQKADKYDRIANMSDEQVDKIKLMCHETITGDYTDEQKQAAAVVSIIAQTGLRPGSKQGFDKTENRGVLTLGPDNVKVTGSRIELDFRGKSYKENEAEIEDGALANYIQELVKSSKDNFLFTIPKSAVEQYYKKTLGMNDFKIKDLRTYIANKVAKIFLNSKEEMPPPVPEKPADIKKAIKNKLKHTFEYVSKKLNNSPAMAKNSYVDPSVIDSWLNKLGVRMEIAEAQDEESLKPVKIVGNVPVYKLPKWWDDDDVELVKDKDVK